VATICLGFSLSADCQNCPELDMKILIFTEGTIIKHQKDKESDYITYVPIGRAVEKLAHWKKQGVEIFYLTSCTKPKEINQIQTVLKKYSFPAGELLFRQEGKEYKDVAEKLMPDILIEDDCQSIGGIDEMTITHVRPELKSKIKSIPVKEFSGIDNLPDKITDLVNFKV